MALLGNLFGSIAGAVHDVAKGVDEAGKAGGGLGPVAAITEGTAHVTGVAAAVGKPDDGVGTIGMKPISGMSPLGAGKIAEMSMGLDLAALGRGMMGLTKSPDVVVAPVQAVSVTHGEDLYHGITQNVGGGIQAGMGGRG